MMEKGTGQHEKFLRIFSKIINCQRFTLIPDMAEKYFPPPFSFLVARLNTLPSMQQIVPETASSATHAAARKNSQAVRWYIMTLPAHARGAERDLQKEIERRKRLQESTFEYFMPQFVEFRHENGRFVNTHKPLYFNYAFIRSSEQDIYRMKQLALRRFNFLPRVRQSGREYYPYLTDEAMRNVRWVARSYQDIVPVCTNDLSTLVQGDVVRIAEGQFEGVEARIVRLPGARKKQLVACVEGWMWIPLLTTQKLRYEIISLAEEKNAAPVHFNYERPLQQLHEALGRHYGPDGATPDDRALALNVLRRLAAQEPATAATRCKRLALLLCATTVLGDTEKRDEIHAAIRALLPAVKAEAVRALLLTTLYGCTNNAIYRQQAQELTQQQQAQENVPATALRQHNRLTDYDRWFGH